MPEQLQTGSFKAYETLKALADTSLSYAQQLPANIEVTPKWAGVGFSLLGSHFVLSMSDLSEMLEVPSYTKLPGVHPWVDGIANVRGRLLPIFDLAAYFDGSLLETKKRQRLLVIEHQKIYAGLRVDQVFGMQYFPVDTRSDQLPENLPSGMLPFMEGCFDLDNNQWGIFKPLKLLEDDYFLDAARI